MFRMFPFIPGYFYYISIALQIICVLHCIRRGTQQRWIWLIVFVPLIGSIAYFFTEIVPELNRGNWQGGLSSLLVSPAARTRRLEENLRFADTFNNRVLLANAYMLSGRTEEAIELYSSSLTGAFSENEYVINRLIAAYFKTERYPELILLAKKIYNTPPFARSEAHLYYARALEITGDKEGAEKEFRKMKGRFADFEARYQYSLFLQRAGRDSEAQGILEDIVKESPHLSSRERRANYTWIQKSREELRGSLIKKG
ncbi:PLDc N-terminal domain-containing protein [Puia dinghuensis]|uniref:PLDc N-terminal domain-containing protein n=1 Tax=Puia dinghuensis TaxID=1792502 RepID=UPI001E53CB0B|nr:PLDc N-terminal domain-containing protein [Puia dinghuensis]